MENYKEKYEQALENLNKIRTANKDNKELVDFIDYKYPELKEINDKKIKEGLIEHLKELRDWTPTELLPIKLKEHYDTWINYLEKQDIEKYENKIIPKFEVGNRISNGINTYLIMEIEKDGWYVTNKGSRLSFYTAHQHYHLV